MNRYRLIYTLLLTALMASTNASAGVTIKGNVYGGGNKADVKTNTQVNMGGGTVEGNVYGGGNLGSVGTYDTSSDMKTFDFTANTGTCNVTISGGTIGTGVEMSADGTFANGNVYGAGKGEADTYWCEKAMAYKTNVIINAGTVNGTVYGGGQIGRVENDATVIIGKENPGDNPAALTIAGNVFGAGAGVLTHGYSALLRGDTKVTIQGNAHIGLNVYGGGEKASVGRFVIKGGLPSEPADDGSGDCIVNVQGTAIIGTNTDNNITDKGNVYGTCQGVIPPTSSEFTAYNTNYTSMQAVAQKAPEGTQGTAWAYVDGSDNKYYWVYYETLDAYKEFLNTLALASHPVVTIGGMLANETTGAVTPSGNPTVNGSVFGGGQRGITLGTVAVNIAGGTIYDDVYGGGALADTNKGNQTAEKYDIATVTEGETDVAGMYELIDDEYTLTEDTKAVESKTYYTKAAQSSINTTTVNLTGGYIKGDAYGGGLGQKDGFNGASNDIEATVWGDIYVTLNGTKFDINHYDETGYTDVVTSGRVFGCNNLLGSPQGDVTVTVNRTVAGNTHRTTGTVTEEVDGVEQTIDKRKSANPNNHSYELAAVYGGGNLAPFATSGKKTHVIIRGCSDTSIETVYGGGNAAPVPETAVDIYSCYEIGSVFGGGNGKDKHKNDNGWQDNPGANVNGPTTTWIYGGTVHEAYGASNKKGTITGTVLIDVANTNPDNCTLDVAKIVGAGKDADVNGDLIMVMGCKPGTKVPALYAGADNAHVNGNVELTITSGKFGQVFGGNNAGGYILGHIKLNIEETGDCATPIEIDELYLGGNQAKYSQYGYYNAETDPTKAPNYQPRTAEMADAESSDFKSPIGEIAGMTVRKEAPYGQPELNIISCTYIGQVFGGGYGTGASLYGNPKVNINMIPGSKASGVPAVMTAKGLTSSENPNNLGIIGTVYGGGNAADVIGDPTVNIGTLQTVDLVSTGVTGNTVVGAYISGNVFGGGKGEAKTKAGTEGEAFLCAKAMVKGDVGTHVNIGNGFVRGNVYGGGEVGRVEHNTAVKIGLDAADVPTGKTSAPTIKGNVFGAGKGVNTHGYSALVRGNSTVTVQADSKVEGSVYGGGEMASVGKYRVENGLPVALAPDNEHPNSGYCYVYIHGNAEIGPDDMEMTKKGGPSDAGHVFGAGKGVLPYEGYTAANAQPFHMNGTQHKVNGVWDNKSWDDAPTWYDAYDPDAELDADYVKFIKSLALATQTVVDISGNPFIKGSVYGGSENGFVQKDTHVTISGGQIGNGYVQMDDDGNYLATKVSVNRRYTSTEWTNGALDVTNDRDALKNAVSTTYYTSSLPECASWPYGQKTGDDKYAPYDMFANQTGDLGKYGNGNSTEGGRAVADDGHTFYGSVFGGGSGYYPYKPGRWFEDAGAVYGNTYVTINGGHILTSVYGGNEMTDVGTYDGTDKLKLTSGGTCNVTMTGGTIGVPRTLKQIEKHPVTCYLFGAGKGDQRVFFNKSTNIGNAVINISEDARIYGSIFGGGEDGHVMKNVTMNILAGPTKTEGDEQIQYPYIGTWGTSYVDGNVFGGGRGFSGDAYTAGNVAGTVTMNIYGGTMLGSIYGGGRLGSVGYGLFDASVTDYYGKMQDDYTREKYDGTLEENFSGFKRGYVYMTIGKEDGTGPTIGNKWEYVNVPTEITESGLAAWKTTNHVPNTEYETTTETITNEGNSTTLYHHRLKHTKGGNVFAGGMGRFYQLTPISGVDWWKLGNVKSTTLTIKGGTIKSNVYGGGELGAVIPYTSGSTVQGGTTEIDIQGGTIGTDIKTGTGESAVVHYTFGSVYGGGMGSENDTSSETKIGGRVEGSTKIDMSGGTVKASVYGGGELAVVQGSHTVKDSNGDPILDSEDKEISVGTEINISGTARVGYNEDGFGGATMGNVYGGGKGSLDTKEAGLIKKNTWISISGTPIIYHNIYGGGAYGSVGTFTYATTEGGTLPASTPSSCTDGTAWITITGGTIGINGHDNGMVFGSSRGDVAVPDATTGEDPNNKLAWVSNTYVTIGTEGQGTTYTTPWISGSVYGSGENGHVLNNTNVAIHSGKIGIEENDGRTYDITSGSTTYKGAEYGTRGNVYGGGCGTDIYNVTTGTGDDAVTKHYFNRSAGVVRGNATITMDGGKVVRSIYGGGAMGSVGKFNRSDKTTDDPYYFDSHVPGFISSCTLNTGLCSVTISGGQVGPSDTTLPDGAGNVFGASRGEIQVATLYPNLDRMAYVDNTEVSIGGTAIIKGSVYGGGETGNVLDNTEVNVCAEKQTSGTTVTYAATSGTPTIGGNVYGGGKGVANSFTCEKAMVGLVDQGVRDNGEDEDPRYTLLDGGTTVRIYNGTVGTLVEGSLKEKTGNVYGGGEIARVERNTVVEIGAATGTTAPVIRGDVFGAGAGLETHGYSALVRGHSTVTVQGSAQVLKNVYGGGEKASVGRYKVKTPANASDADVPSTLPLGMPAHLMAGGAGTVNIQGSATIGTEGVATTGHVYGAGKGVEPTYAYTAYTSETPYTTRITNSRRMVAYTSSTVHPDGTQYKEWDYYDADHNYVWEYFPTNAAYLQFVESLALTAETFATIGGKRNESTGEITSSGTPTVKGSVFGGSESGFVYKNTDVKIVGGTVEGDAFGGGRGLESFAEAGRVKWNTGLAVSGGTVKGNVYGGGNLGDVGTIYKPAGSYDYGWKNTDCNGNNLDTGNNNSHINNYHETTDPDKKNTGICTVNISGGTIGLASTNEPTKHGNVFGAGQGSWHTWWCEKAIVYATDVNVSAGTVYGNVYGGGEVGRVEDDAKVTIGTPGETGADKPNITGSVFGGGAGLATHGYSALVRGNSAVTVQGASKVGSNVYGGGEIASVGRFKVVGGLPTKPKGGGTCTVVVKDNAVTGDVYGSCKGVTPNYVESGTNRSKSMQLVAYKPAGAEGTTWDYYKDEAGKKDERFIWVYYTKDAYLAFLPTLGLASNTHVTIGGSSAINGSVYGGGQRGITLGGVDVNINGGTVSQDVYGGGALANSNSSHWHEGHRTDYVELDELYKGIPLNGYYTKSGDDTYTLINDGSTADGDQLKKYYAIFKTNVNLKGGTVNHNVYGGGLGQLAKAGVDGVHYTQEEIDAAQEGDAAFGKTTGDWKVEPVESLSAIEAKVYGDVSVKLNETIATDNCEVKGTIFGCNNLNGSPQAGVDVHIYKTYTVSGKPAKNTNNYEVTAVYGGGNLAAYYPDDATIRENATAYVTIDGCELTSIGSVYGGGNAASVPATEVVINGTYEIGEAFGGGNGKDRISYDGTNYEDNPGANVGLRAYPDANNLPYDTKQNRDTNYGYGPGKSHITIYGGTVHSVYGGSNLRGNVRVESRTTLEDADNGCDFNVGKAYGGGNNAPQDGDAVLEIGCISGLEKAYGGASNADVNGDVVLNITNGTYGRVFGGNDLGGNITGSITVNIEETGCRPIIIGELYGGGNEAGYSIYGYKKVTETDESTGETVQVWRPRESSTDSPDGAELSIPDPLPKSPQVNVKSFTSIGTVYGGGYGGPATMVGSPEVNINVFEGEFAEKYNGNDNVIEDNARIVGSTVTTNASISGYGSGYPIPSHAKGAIGAINNVFGGGNAAEVIGTPHVNIGTLTGEVITLASKKIEDSEGKAPTDEGWIPSYQLATVKGVDIRGNVYGAGNNAKVTGDTEVVIGKNNDVKTYSFTSYNAASDGTAWSSGLAQTTGATETISDKEYAEVVILTNGKYGEYIGKKFYVYPEGSGRLQLFDEDKHATSLWVDIEPFELKTYNFKSYGSASDGTQYSAGTAAPTGNFKTLNSTECMQIVVLTNPGEASWVGKTFYVPIAIADATRRQLYKADGNPINVWVEITE